MSSYSMYVQVPTHQTLTTTGVATSHLHVIVLFAAWVKQAGLK